MHSVSSIYFSNLCSARVLRSTCMIHICEKFHFRESCESNAEQWTIYSFKISHFILIYFINYIWMYVSNAKERQKKKNFVFVSLVWFAVCAQTMFVIFQLSLHTFFMHVGAACSFSILFIHTFFLFAHFRYGWWKSNCKIVIHFGCGIKWERTARALTHRHNWRTNHNTATEWKRTKKWYIMKMYGFAVNVKYMD